MNTFAEENYIKALFNLADERGEVSVNEISKKLGIKMPTVNGMMKKLAEKKIVHYESYKPLKLTSKGRKLAGLIIRKHRLMEMYLVEKMGFSWDEVHEIAEQIEHIQSPKFFEKIDELLGHPKIDPHGSPIPDKKGAVSWLQYDKLCDIKQGTTVRLNAVIHSNLELLKYLTSKGLKLGIELQVIAIEEYDGTMTVSYNNKPSEYLSQKVCESLLVSKVTNKIIKQKDIKT
ncbi:MAG: metal-dependent transcriptional regulator [Cytophagales bacterium]|nr:metal-dependent transcriptional regulator [Cytophagales bacterium]